MANKVGTYYLGRHFPFWGIWRIESFGNGITISFFIKDVPSFDAAHMEIYRLNRIVSN